jgi:hypothetical protein
MKDDSWHVKTVQRGLHMTISQATGVTPSELLFGTKLRFVPESIREKAKAGFDTEQSEQKQRIDAERAKAPREIARSAYHAPETCQMLEVNCAKYRRHAQFICKCSKNIACGS